jgi:hypothetical protein
VKTVTPSPDVSQELDYTDSNKNGQDDNGSEEIIVEDRSVEEFESDGPLRSQPESDDKGSTTTAVVITVVLLLLIITIVIGFVLHKRRISPKTLVQPYVQQL